MSQKVSQRKRKKLDTLQSREYGDGITAYLYHNDDKESDNVSEITQNEHDIPSFVSVPKKNSAFDKLFKALFTKKHHQNSLLNKEIQDQEINLNSLAFLIRLNIYKKSMQQMLKKLRLNHQISI